MPKPPLPNCQSPLPSGRWQISMSSGLICQQESGIVCARGRDSVRGLSGPYPSTVCAQATRINAVMACARVACVGVAASHVMLQTTSFWPQN